MKTYSRAISRQSPLSRIISRTIVYGVFLGLPLIFVWSCLAVTVARTWAYVGNPIFILIACLTGGLVFVVIVGALVGGAMAILTRLLYSRIQDPARYRLLVALVPLAVITFIILSLLSDDRRPFWPPLRYPFELRLLDVAGWTLATSVTVGISQIVAHKYDSEATTRKRKAPVVMWRAIPLVTMVLSITLFSVVLPFAIRLLSLAIMPELWSPDISVSRHIFRATCVGLSQGLIFGNVLTVATMLGFSEMRRPRFYRFTMATITLMIAITFRSHVSIQLYPTVFEPAPDLPMVLLTLAHDAVFICLIALSVAWYCREASKPQRKSHERPYELQTDDGI